MGTAMQTAARAARKPVPRKAVPSRSSAGSHVHPTHQAILQLQRLAGNRATTALLKGPPPAPEGGRPTVQRHAGWEHTLLGDTDPRRLSNAVVNPATASHVKGEEYQRIWFFKDNATLDPRVRFPKVKWIQLKGSGLWLSYGELNALADYLPSASAIDELPRDVVLPVLQRMRRTTSQQIMELRMEGEGSAGVFESTTALVAETKAVDWATAKLGPDRYTGLLSRNACHFAPLSWTRWANHHNEARAQAEAYRKTATTNKPLKDIDSSANEHLRQAWLNNGYGDHFLQDSFASGHLVNKTLVMQWFVEYINELPSKWWDLFPLLNLGLHTQPWRAMPDKQVMSAMTTSAQPEMAARSMYGTRPQSGGPTVSADRAGGMTQTDPQTAQERTQLSGKIAGSGVNATTSFSQVENYQAFLRFLNSTLLSLAGNDAHTYFNETGLWVSNPQGDKLRVGGDDTLLAEGAAGPLGTLRTAEAAEMSRNAIDDLLKTGATTHTVDSIMQLVPDSIWTQNKDGLWAKRPLETWQDEVLHQVCIDEIFPKIVETVVKSKAGLASKVARTATTVVSESGVAMGDAPGLTAARAAEMSDGDIRDWVEQNPRQAISNSPLEAKLVVLNRLLNGWVSDDDLDAFQIIHRTSTSSERAEIRDAIMPRSTELQSLGQRHRLRLMLSGSM